MSTGSSIGTSTAERVQMGRQHIFVINGSAAFLEVLRALFEDEQYNVTTTNYVPQTFDQIAALQPALLIIDLVIGQQAGWDLLERLQAEVLTRQIPVIVVSTDPHLLERAKADQARYGGQRFLSKPLDLGEILEGVRSLVGPA
jgi:CheY-like chemotaxis protein